MSSAQQTREHGHHPRVHLRYQMEAYMKDYYYSYFNEADELESYYLDKATITTDCENVDVAKVASRLTTDKVEPTNFEIKTLDAVPVQRDNYKGDVIVTVKGNVVGGASSYLCNQ
ncbi:hypothetical protein MKW92_029341, partial [Papaver armeniacum]